MRGTVESSTDESTMEFLDDDTEVEYMVYILSSHLKNFVTHVKHFKMMLLIASFVFIFVVVVTITTPAQGANLVGVVGARTVLMYILCSYILTKLGKHEVASYVTVEQLITTSWTITGLCIELFTNFQFLHQDTSIHVVMLGDASLATEEVAVGDDGELSAMFFRLWITYIFAGNTLVVFMALLVACHGLVRFNIFKYPFVLVQAAHVIRFTFLTHIPLSTWVAYVGQSALAVVCVVVTFKVMEHHYRSGFMLVRRTNQLKRELEAAKELVRLEKPTALETSVVRLAFADFSEDFRLEEELQRIRRVPFNELVFQERIGAGSQGEVIRATYLGTPVAVKRLLRNRIEPKYMTAFVKEVLLLQRLSHPNIVQFVGASWDNAANVCSVMELVHRGSLHSVLKADANKLSCRLTWFEPKLRMAIDTACGLSYLHNHTPTIIHRDMKPDNILVTKTYACKLTDFGVARALLQSRSEAMTITGTPKYVAPEVLLGQPYDERVDIFGFGMCLLAMHLHDDPWAAGPGQPRRLSGAEAQCRVAGGERPGVPFDFPAELVAILQRCWSHTPSERPGALELGSLLRQAQSEMVLAPAVRGEQLLRTSLRPPREVSVGWVGGDSTPIMGGGSGSTTVIGLKSPPKQQDAGESQPSLPPSSPAMEGTGLSEPVLTELRSASPKESDDSDEMQPTEVVMMDQAVLQQQEPASPPAAAAASAGAHHRRSTRRRYE